jgi:hypothetical protein
MAESDAARAFAQIQANQCSARVDNLLGHIILLILLLR